MNTIEQWIILGDEDFEAAEIMLHSGKWKFTVFLCQQALEKYLKALYIKYKKELPLPIHNLFRLAEQIEKELFKEDDLKFFSELSHYYLASRYPEDLQKMKEIGKHEKAEEVIKRTREIREWLKKKLS